MSEPSQELEPVTAEVVDDSATPPEVLQALYVAAIKSWAVKEEDVTRALAAKFRQTVGTTPYRAPTGEALGTLQRTDPPPRWMVTNQQELDEWLATDPANMDSSEELDPPSMDALLDLVREHHPEWLKEITYVMPAARAEALAHVKETGKACPGVTLERETGRLIVKAAKGAREVFARMIRAGDLDPDGTTPELAAQPRRRAVRAAPRLPELGTRVSTRMKDQADDAYDRGGDDWVLEPEDPFAGVAVDPFAGIEIQQ
jgi:hypothetical protein